MQENNAVNGECLHPRSLRQLSYGRTQFAVCGATGYFAVFVAHTVAVPTSWSEDCGRLVA